MKVEYPNGWETLTGGEPVNVTWSTSLPGGYVKILYSTDNGSTWNAITDPAITNAGTTGSFAWTVPNIDADHVLARAEWYNQLLVPFVTLAKDLSDQEFKIKSSGTFATITLNPIYLTELTSAESVPSDLTATIESNISIKLDWSDNATWETGYIIERKDGSNDWQEIVTLAADSQSYTDSSCSPATQYTYRVEATYGGSMTASSNEATATTSGLLISAVTMNHNPALEEYPNQGTVTTITLIFTLDSNSFTSNGQVQDMDVAPVIVDNRVLLPLRFVSVPLGATPEWKAVEGKAVITLGATVLEIWPGQAEASLNGQKVYIDPDNHNVTAIVDSGRVMVPLRFVAESLGAIPDWNSSTQEITITK